MHRRELLCEARSCRLPQRWPAARRRARTMPRRPGQRRAPASMRPRCATWRATWRSSPTRRPTPRCRTRSGEPRLPGLSRDPLRSGQGAVARPGPEVHRRVLPSRLPLQGPRRHLRGGGRPARRRSATARTCSPSTRSQPPHRRSRLRRLPPPLPAQPAGLFRRGLRLPRRQLFPRGRQGPGLRPVGARPGDQDRATGRRGIPALPPLLAGAAGEGQRRASWSTPCSTARAPPRRSASPSGPAQETVFDTEMALYPRTDITQAGHRAADQHVPVRRQRPHRLRRLPRRGARFERPADADRPGRADLAAARPIRATCRSAPSRHRPARLRPDAARARASSTTRTWKRVTRSARRCGSSRSATGARARRTGGDPHQPRGQRQHRRVLAAAGSAAGQGRISPELPAALVLGGAGRGDAGAGRRRPAAACRSTRRTGSSSSTSPAAR